MSKQRIVNGVLLIGGIASFLFTIVAVILGLPGWMVIVGATMNAILHLFYQPGKQTDSSEAASLLQQQDIGRIQQETRTDTIGMEKVLRIQEEYEKKLRLLEEEKTKRIAELEQELAEEKERSQQLKTDLEQSNTALSASILPELGPDENKLVKVDVVEFAQKVAEGFMKDAQDKGIDIHVAGVKGYIFVQASEKMLLVLFQNIIDNGIKYMNQKGIMQITITDLDEDIFIVIKDSGQGLSESETAHVFELNFQGSNRVSGNGLGLAQVKAIVDYYGGMVYAKSSADKGMGIYIHLPATRENIE